MTSTKITNEKIAKIFYELADLRKDERHQSLALTNAARIIDSIDYPITEKTLSKFGKERGIGKGSLDRVKEILETGVLKELQKKRKSIGMQSNSSSGESDEEETFDFESILGFGPKSAEKIIKAGYTTLEELKKDVKKKKIKVTDLQRFGIMNYEDLLLRIPREEVQRIGSKIIEEILNVQPTVKLEIVGSYRRQRPDSGDIDILISDQRHERYKEYLLHGNIVDMISDLVNSTIKNKNVRNKFEQILEESSIPLRNLTRSSVVKKIDNMIEENIVDTVVFVKKYRKLIKEIENNIPHGSIVNNFKQLLSLKEELDILPGIVEDLQKNGIIEKVLSLGHVKLMAAYKENGLIRKFDIRLMPLISYATALLHSTGSDNFNVKLRRKALFLDYSLSEYGLHTFSSNQWVETNSEKDIFDILDEPYVPPEKRN